MVSRRDRTLWCSSCRPATRAPKPRPAKAARIPFTVSAGRSRELIPGKVWFGVSRVDTAERRVDGWIRVAPLRRTIWLRNQSTTRPVTFRERDQEFSLVVTKTHPNAVSGYLVGAAGARKPSRYVATVRR